MAKKRKLSLKRKSNCKTKRVIASKFKNRKKNYYQKRSGMARTARNREQYSSWKMRAMASVDREKDRPNQ